MKYLLLLLLLTATIAAAQPTRIQPHDFSPGNPAPDALANDTTYDVHFYHIDLEIAIDYPYLTGSVNFLVRSKTDGLNSLQLDLDDAFTVDSVSGQASGFSFAGKVLTIHFSESFNQGETIAFAVHYHGAPVLAGGYKGLRYETHDGGQPVIASLSTPYLAHTWWPCKDGTGDKADSTFIDITIADTIIGGLPVIAVSNGILENTISANGKKTFQWRHRYPVVPYYVMVAISNYTHFQQTFIGLGYTFPIDYYVFQSHLADAQNGVVPLPGAMAFFTELFGPYPFREEKYGMTQLGYYGGIENQTNSIINKMNQDWFYVSVHELAHMWFADMITCDTWHHGWLNEGFASYAEALYAEHAGGTPAYRNYMTSFEFYNAGTLYMPDVSNPFTVFQSIIYDKGAYVLHMLRGILGDDLFFETLHSYATNASFQYDHATTEDLQTTCEQVSGLDLDYFFEEWIYDERYPQYRFNYSYDPAEELLHLWIAQTQGELGWREVFEMPVQVRATFTDGTDTTVTVFNDAQTQYFHFSFEKEVNLVELDPDKWILREVQYDPGISVGVRDFGDIQVRLFPNPNHGSFSIHLPAEAAGDVKLTLYDLQGRIRYQRTFAARGNEDERFDIQELEQGIYFLQLRSGSDLFQKKMVVLD